MRCNILFGTLGSLLVALLAFPAWAQDLAPTPDAKPRSADPAPQAPPPPPSSEGAAPSTDTATPPSGDAPVAPAPELPHDEPAPSNALTADGVATTEEAATADSGPTIIGERLSPLIVSAAAGYAVASVKYPGLTSRNLDGPFLEVSAGIELERRFRVAIAFTSFETKMRRTRAGDWEEGDFGNRVATAGLRSTRDPIEPVILPVGGVEVQRMFLAHSLGPRVDFLPLGSQGPYIGLTTALAITHGLETRFGADVGARVGGEWRPFQQFSFGVEAGAHGQIYGDGNAAIPYATARINLLLDTRAPKSKGSAPTPTGPILPRNLPTTPMQR